MNIRQLKQEIKDLPDTMDVFMDERLTDFRYGLLNTGKVKKINFMEDPDGEALTKDEAFILSED